MNKIDKIIELIEKDPILRDLKKEYKTEKKLISEYNLKVEIEKAQKFIDDFFKNILYLSLKIEQINSWSLFQKFTNF